MIVPNGTINDPAHVEHEIMRNATWLRRACVEYVRNGGTVGEVLDCLATEFVWWCEVEHWEQSEVKRGNT